MIAWHVIATTSAAAALSVPSSSLPRTGILHLIFSTGASARPRLICPGYRLWYLACPPWGTLGAILRSLRRSPLVCERERHTTSACSSNYFTFGLAWIFLCILSSGSSFAAPALCDLCRRHFSPDNQRVSVPLIPLARKGMSIPPHSFCYR